MTNCQDIKTLNSQNKFFFLSILFLFKFNLIKLDFYLNLFLFDLNFIFLDYTSKRKTFEIVSNFYLSCKLREHCVFLA